MGHEQCSSAFHLDYFVIEGMKILTKTESYARKSRVGSHEDAYRPENNLGERM